MSVKVDTRETSSPKVVDEVPRSGGASRRRARVGAGGIVLALGLVVLATQMKGNADFAEDYVARQLGQQRISFKAADLLTDDERAKPCLVAYAGTLLTTGEQAECYANHFIGEHLPKVAGGKTFSEMREVQTVLRAQISAAQATNDPSVGDLQRQLAEVTGKRQSLFEGETMKGLLLTTYGFSTLGAKAGQAATVAFLGAGLVLLLSMAALVRRADG